MKFAILTRHPRSVAVFEEAIIKQGHTPVVSDFKSAISLRKLFECDIFMPRISRISYNHVIEITKKYNQQRPDGVMGVTPEGIRQSCDKYVTYTTMRDNALPTPWTTLISEAHDAEILASKLPLVLKPRTENRGKNIAVIDDSLLLKAYAQKLLALYGSCIAQTFVSESAGRDIRAFVVGSSVVAAMERTAPEGSYIANLAMGGTASPVRLTAEEEALAVKATHLFGAEYAGVDILRSNEGPTILEVNVSPGTKIAAVVQKDVPALIIQHLASKRAAL